LENSLLPGQVTTPLVGLDAVDFNRGKLLAVSLFTPIAFTALVLENENLLGFALLDDAAGDRDIVKLGGADPEIFAIGKQQDILEGDFGPDITGKFFHPQDVTFLNPVLFSACFDHSVHTASLIPSGIIATAPRVVYGPDLCQINFLGFKTLQYYFTKVNCQAKKPGHQI
jgi:hypothetical protein